VSTVKGELHITTDKILAGGMWECRTCGIHFWDRYGFPFSPFLQRVIVVCPYCIPESTVKDKPCADTASP
jgi:hypothetical protein